MGTFGFSDFGNEGTASTTTGVDQLAGGKFTLTEDGTVTKISAHLRSSTNRNVKAVIVKSSDLTIVANGVSNVTVSTASTTNFAWFDFTFTTNPVLTAADYYLCIVGEGSALRFACTSTGGHAIFDDTNSYTTPTNPTDGTTTGVQFYRIYATYTPAGGSSAIKSVNGLAKASAKSVNGLAIANVKSWNGLE